MSFEQRQLLRCFIINGAVHLVLVVAEIRHPFRFLNPGIPQHDVGEAILVQADPPFAAVIIDLHSVSKCATGLCEHLYHKLMEPGVILSVRLGAIAYRDAAVWGSLVDSVCLS